jgi:hypothetical protein
MATNFSVAVAIGGKVLPSLASSVNATKAQVRGLEATLAKINAGISAPFVAAQKHIDATAKRLAGVQKTGRNLAMSVSAPVAFGAVGMIRKAGGRDKQGNFTEALGGVSHTERLDIEKFADSIATKYGSATDILKSFNEALKTGFSVPAAKGAMPAIMEGSIVGDMRPDEVVGAVGKMVAQYGLGMKTIADATASSRRITDNLAYGANATSASMKDMIEAYKFVGSAASAAGESIESTNALIIGLNQSGQLGSEAGVALRSAYVRLLKPTKAGRATMAKLGLDYGNYVSGGKRTGAGIAAGFGASGFEMSAKDIDAALAQSGGDIEGQRKAIYGAVVAKFGAEAAKDREAVLKAVDDAFTMAGSKVDLTKLLVDLKKKGAGQGDLANIFEGRQSVRMLALLRADIEGILRDLNASVAGYGERTFDTFNQGLTKAIRELTASWETFSNTLVKAGLPEIVSVFSRVTKGLQSLSATNPALLRTGLAITAIGAAAGPAMFILGGIGRVATVALGGVVASAGMMAAGVTRAMVGVGAASLLAVGRLRAFAVGALALNAVGGVRAVLGGIAGSLGRLALAPFAMIAAGMRGIAMGGWAIVANPAGLIITGIVAALVALGIWVSNNWAGIKQFFAAFGEGFMSGLGPAGDTVRNIASALGDVAKWVSDLLGPIDETGTKWREWGSAVGGAAASGVNAVIDGIQRLIGFMSTVIQKASAVGSAIANMWSSPKTLPNAPKASPIAGARAMGGPVSYGRRYLVGEKGPEIFTPGARGQITSNDRLRALTADGTAAVAGSSSTTTTNHGPVTLSPTFVINGADNPAAVERQIEQYMQRLMAEQRGLLSD